MTKTTIVLAIALVTAAFVIAAPPAAADDIVECLDRPGHEPAHCVWDCTPLAGPEYNPLRCDEHDH